MIATKMDEARYNQLVASICEFFKASFHTILYIRNVYPKIIFEKCKKYNVPIWHAMEPSINDYIDCCLCGLHQFLMNKVLEKVEFCILDRTEVPMEKYIFKVKMLEASGEEDTVKLIEAMEKSFRDLLLRISSSGMYLRKKPYGWRFCVLMQCKNSATVPENISKEPHIIPVLENSTKEAEEGSDIDSSFFPLVMDDATADDRIRLTPLKTLENPVCKMQLYVLTKHPSD